MLDVATNSLNVRNKHRGLYYIRCIRSEVLPRKYFLASVVCWEGRGTFGKMENHPEPNQKRYPRDMLLLPKSSSELVKCEKLTNLIDLYSRDYFQNKRVSETITV